MLTHTQLQFLVLLRAGLWDKPVNINELLDPEKYQSTENKNKPQNKRNNKKNTESANDSQGIVIDWPAIYHISREQTVVGLIVDAINTLPAELMPPKAIAQRFAIDKLNIERSHLKLNSVLKIVVEALNKEGIPHVLLKGQGVAQNYPNPTSRTCGDIDLYIGQDNFEYTKEILITLSDNPKEKIKETIKHASFQIHGIEIEIHRIATYFGSQRTNERFQSYTYTILDASMNNLTNTHPLEEWNNMGSIIYMPCPTYNAIFQITHMIYHFIDSGIGLRQLCDWTRLIYTHTFNELELQKVIKEFKLEKAWTGIASIAHNFLGLPQENIPYCNNIDKKLSERMLRIIFMTGNFGQYDTAAPTRRNKKYLKQKYNRFIYHLKYFTRIFPLFPNMVTAYIFQWLKEGIKTVLKSK